MANVLENFLMGSEAGMKAQNFREAQALRQQQAERDTETYDLNKSLQNAKIIKGAMDAIEKVGDDPQDRYETAMRMRPQLEKLGVKDIPFDQLTPEEFTPERFKIHKASIAGFIADPQSQLTAWERERAQTLKDLQSEDPTIREYAERLIGKTPRATADKVTMVGGVPMVTSATDKTAVPLMPSEDVASQAAEIELAKKEAEKRGDAIAKLRAELANTHKLDEFLDQLPTKLKGVTDAPSSKLSSVLNSGVSYFIGNTKAADAQSRLSQLANMVLSVSPFAPGSQSDKELQARRAELANTIDSSGITIEEKIAQINQYISFMELKRRSIQQSIKDLENAGKTQRTESTPAEAPKADMSELEAFRAKLGDL